MTRAEAARMLRVEAQTLAVWASTGRHSLPFVRVGARAMYRVADVERWLADRSGTSTSAITATTTGGTR